MSVNLPNGTLFYGASGYGSALTVTGATNANPTVLTSTAHGLATGDFVEVTSGWSRISNRIFRVIELTADTFSLEGVDTTDTSVYPAGSGTGSVRKITGWTQIQQVLSTTSSGGDQQFVNYQFLEDDHETRKPTIKAAAGLDMSIADDPTLAGYILLSAANDDRQPRALKAVLSNGSILLYNAYLSLDKTPSLTANQVMACKATASFLNPNPTRYAS